MKQTRFWGLVAVAILVGCRDRVEAPRQPLVDSAGEAHEHQRIDFQWLAVQGKLDSVLNTPNGMKGYRLVRGSLDSAITRYRDSMQVEGGQMVSRSGGIDWRATWLTGRFDRSAMATAMVRSFTSDSASVVEWFLSDSAALESKLHAMYTTSGANGGTLDSVVLGLSSDQVMVVK